MKKTIIALAALALIAAALVAAAAADQRETLHMVTTPEKAALCVKVGCGLYTAEDIQTIVQRARAEAMLDVARSLDTQGCLRGNT